LDVVPLVTVLSFLFEKHLSFLTGISKIPRHCKQMELTYYIIL